MKNPTLWFLTFVMFALSLSSCSKSGKACKGGGWYGDRNLSFEVNEQQSIETTTFITTAAKPVEDCK